MIADLMRELALPITYSLVMALFHTNELGYQKHNEGCDTEHTGKEIGEHIQLPNENRKK